MNWEAIGAIGEILGAVVVIATLGFLAGQIRQGNRIAQGQAMRDIIGQFNESMQRWADTPETIPLMQRGMADYASLTSVEKAHFAFRIAPMMNQLDVMIRLNKDDQFPDDMLDDFVAICVSIVTTPGGKQYWEDSSATLNTQVVSYLSDQMKDDRVRKPATDLGSHWVIEDS